MELTRGNILHGFEVTSVRPVEELNSRLVEMKHIKTGAQLIWMDAPEENKLFSIAFKTLPEDSTGVFHILEHSVLCGSDKFPVREPFLELCKSSMQTFLNAMTFSDKTMYPVSSRNEADFMNLTEVYLDAVFRPALLNNPSIFAQEGWHYELHEGDEKPVYQGVVFNEMKGATSGLDDTIWEGVMAALYPDTCYGFNSGGDPASIPDLSYEQFVETYKRFYHPSNARIYLDGQVPLDRVLALIDGDYLSKFDRRDDTPRDVMQPAVPAAETVQYYEIAADTPLEGQAHMALGRILCDWSEHTKQVAADVLTDCLTGTNDAPLKRALLDAGVCKDVDFAVFDSLLQPFSLLLMRNTDKDKGERIRQIIDETVAGLIKNGIDRRDLEASIDRVEFKLREGSEPRGLMRCIKICNSWMYGGDPIMYLGYNDMLAELRAGLDNGYFERLLGEMLGEGEGRTVVWTLPSTTLGDEKRAVEAARIEKESAAWSADERAAVIAAQGVLDEWQRTPDSREALDTLPQLALSDVSPEVIGQDTVILEDGGVPVLYHPTNVEGIDYVSMYFSCGDLTADELFDLSLLASLLGDLPAGGMSVTELQRQTKSTTGKLTFDAQAFSILGDTERCEPMVHARCSVLSHNLGKAAELMHTVFTKTDLTLREQIRELVVQKNETNKQMVVETGHMYALARASAGHSAEAAYEELTSGFTAYERIRALAQDFDAQADVLIERLTALQKRVFTRGRLTVSIAAKEAPADLGFITAAYPEGGERDLRTALELPISGKQGIQIPAAVSFASLAPDLNKYAPFDRAALRVLSSLLSFGFLWGEIRVQGGAYGAGMVSRNNGVSGFYTFRDPQPQRSLDVFRRAFGFVREYCASDESLSQYIISTIGKTEPLVSVGDEAAQADAEYFRKITKDYRREERGRMLGMTKADLAALCDRLEKAVAEGSICVVGAAPALADCGKEELEVSLA